MLASQLGAPISYISEQKGSDLLAIKKKLGLPIFVSIHQG